VMIVPEASAPSVHSEPFRAFRARAPPSFV
jgi:hypothetical protein